MQRDDKMCVTGLAVLRRSTMRRVQDWSLSAWHNVDTNVFNVHITSYGGDNVERLMGAIGRTIVGSDAGTAVLLCVYDEQQDKHYVQHGEHRVPLSKFNFEEG